MGPPTGRATQHRVPPASPTVAPASAWRALKAPEGDTAGLCLTPQEEARVCSGPLAGAFYCAGYDIKDGGSQLDGVNREAICLVRQIAL